MERLVSPRCSSLARTAPGQFDHGDDGGLPLLLSLDLSGSLSLALSVVCVYDNDARTQPHTARIDHAPRRAAVQSLLAAGALLG